MNSAQFKTGPGQIPKTVGILGIGHLAGFVVEGLINAGARYNLVLSPRNAKKSQALADRFGLQIAENNQELVDRSDLIFICLPVRHGLEILSGLKFSGDQIILSAMANTNFSDLEEAIAPGKVHTAMMPGYANSYGKGPSILFPANEACRSLLQHLGPVHEFDDGEQFRAASTFGGFSGASFIFMQHIIKWFVDQGIKSDLARDLVAQTLAGNAHVLCESDEQLNDIVTGVATPGGISEQCARIVDQRGGFEAWAEALDSVMANTRSVDDK